MIFVARAACFGVIGRMDTTILPANRNSDMVPGYITIMSILRGQTATTSRHADDKPEKGPAGVVSMLVTYIGTFTCSSM